LGKGRFGKGEEMMAGARTVRLQQEGPKTSAEKKGILGGIEESEKKIVGKKGKKKSD